MTEKENLQLAKARDGRWTEESGGQGCTALNLDFPQQPGTYAMITNMEGGGYDGDPNRSIFALGIYLNEGEQSIIFTQLTLEQCLLFAGKATYFLV